MCHSCLFKLPVLVNGEELWTNGRAVVRMQLWSRKKQPIVPGTSEKCDLLLAGSVCLAQRRTDRWGFRVTQQSLEIDSYVLFELKILPRLSYDDFLLRKLPSQEFVVPLGVTSFSAPRQDFTAVVLAAVIVEVINSMYCSFQPVWHTGTADALHRQRGLCYQLMYWFCDESEGVHHEGECACLWERIYTLFS